MTTTPPPADEGEVTTRREIAALALLNQSRNFHDLPELKWTDFAAFEQRQSLIAADTVLATPDPAHDARIRADVLAEVEALQSAGDALFHRLVSALAGKPVRDAEEALAAWNAAIRALAKPTEPRPGAGDAGEG